MLLPRQNAAICTRGCRCISRTAYRAPRKVSSRKSLFPHGFSATEHLVPPSKDNSTPITDSLPRSPILDPTTYKRKHTKHRDPPPYKSSELLTAFEQSILENPFAKLLASPIRRDRIAEHVLPRNLLLKFIIYSSPSDSYWLMPADLPPHPQTSPQVGFRGVYARLNKQLIKELSAKQKRWRGFVPENTSQIVRKKLVWREGMGEWIEGVLREEAWKRLDALPRKFLFGCEVDEEVRKAVVGSNIGKRIKTKKNTSAMGADETAGTEDEQSEPNPLLTEAAAQRTAADQVEAESTGNQTKPTSLENLVLVEEGDKGQIIAILYLSPLHTTEAWEFKSIGIEGQETQAVVFNLRRLFPGTAESYMKLRVGEGNALAVMSSEMTCTILYHMLRLAMYLEGAEPTLLEEKVQELGVEDVVGETSNWPSAVGDEEKRKVT